jgi:hypothetical protein
VQKAEADLHIAGHVLGQACDFTLNFASTRNETCGTGFWKSEATTAYESRAKCARQIVVREEFLSH